MWNSELIEFVFCPNTGAQILCIPLTIHGGDDVIYWPSSVDGLYSSKQGYGFIRSAVVAAQASSSFTASPLQPKQWKKLWSSSSIPRCKELAWRACSGLLPVRTTLVWRGVDVEADCPLCGLELETIDHL